MKILKVLTIEDMLNMEQVFIGPCELRAQISVAHFGDVMELFLTLDDGKKIAAYQTDLDGAVALRHQLDEVIKKLKEN